MAAKVCLITGATAGIGRATAERLAEDGVNVVMVSRDKERGELARREVSARSGNQSVEVLTADLSSLDAVRRLADEFGRAHANLDVLINDAATYLGSRVLTSEGLETMFATNYLGPFLLTRLLIPRLESAKPSRVIAVTAPSTTRPDLDDLQGERKFGSLRAFGASKAEDLLFTFALARKLQGRGVTANAYHPGIVRTGLMRRASAPVRFLTRLMGASPEEAAKGLARLATSPDFAGTTGKLVHKGKEISAPFVEDMELQEGLWRKTSQMAGLPEEV